MRITTKRWKCLNRYYLDRAVGPDRVALAWAACRDGLIQEWEIELNASDRLILSGVSDHHQHRVRVVWDGGRLISSCTCETGGMCEHAIALSLIWEQTPESTSEPLDLPREMIAADLRRSDTGWLLSSEDLMNHHVWRRWLALYTQEGEFSWRLPNRASGLLELLSHYVDAPTGEWPSASDLPPLENALLMRVDARSDRFAMIKEMLQGSEGPTLLIISPMDEVNWKRACQGDAHIAFDQKAFTGGCLVQTYAQLRRHRDGLKQVNWGQVILDEAQYLKHPISLTAQALSELPCRRRLGILTLPLDRSPLSLAAVFRFLQPDLLGNDRQFRFQVYNLLRTKDPLAVEILRSLVRPFTLDLSLDQQSQHHLYSPLTKDQKRLYQDCLASPEFEEIKLRKITAHSRLIHPEAPRHSHKAAQLIHLLDQLTSIHERVLVLSQFAEIIPFLRERSHRFGERAELIAWQTWDESHWPDCRCVVIYDQPAFSTEPWRDRLEAMSCFYLIAADTIEDQLPK